MRGSCKAAILLSILHLSSCMHTLGRAGPPKANHELVVNPDGSYRYSYDTNTGGFQNEQKRADGSITGNYGFNAPGGGSVNVRYSAVGGTGEGEENTSGTYGSSSGFSKSSSTYSATSGMGGSSFGPAPSKGTYTMKLRPSGEYSYEYALADQRKSEHRDADGKVRGQFSFTDPEGESKHIRYTADESGFRAEGEHIPTDAQTAEAAGFATSGGAASSLYSASSQQQASSQHQASSQYQASSGFGGQRTSYSGAAATGGTGTLTMNLKPDGAYSYSYSMNDQEKTEHRDQSGKVRGSYSYTDPEGQKKAIEYTADEGGFQATGDHIPVAGQPELASGTYNSGFGAVGGGFTGTAYTSQTSGASFGGYSAPRGPLGSGTMNMQFHPDGQYSYNYKLNDQSKSETRTGDGKVSGEFSFTNPEGQKVAIRYKADENGFQPEGDHIPKPSEEFLAAHRAAAVAAAQMSSYSGAGAYAGENVDYNAGAYDASSSGAAFESSAPAGPFSFAYNAGDHTHRQSSSGSGQVSGQYSAASAGGSTKVSYTAQGKQGFSPVVEASSNVGDGAVEATRFTGTGAFDSTKYVGVEATHDAGSSDTDSAAAFQANAPAAPFSFSYNAGDHTHRQSSSGSGQVNGQYSAVSDGGSTKVSYTAQGKQGFNPVVEVSSNIGATAAEAIRFAGKGTLDNTKYVSAQNTQDAGSYSNFGADSGSSSAGTGGGYSFSYSAENQAHSQSNPAAGLVQGEYSASGEGANEKVSYSAGGKQGYLASVQTSANVGGGSGQASAHNSGSRYSATESASRLTSGSQYKATGDAQLGNAFGKGASYSYSYETLSQQHNAKGNDGNVEGKYSVSGIGSSQQSSYTAGKQGFLPTHDITFNVGVEEKPKEEETKAAY